MKIKENIIDLVDNLKVICRKYGIGNDGDEYKIIIQVFLYKFIHDKFGYEIRKISTKFNDTWEEIYLNLSKKHRQKILNKLPSDTFYLNPEHLIISLYNKRNDDNLDKLLDNTLLEINRLNENILIHPVKNTKISLFNKITKYIDKTKRNAFAKDIIAKLVKFSFKDSFTSNYDFFATIFEYLIKDYNVVTGKYAEYYTPHSIADIVSKLLVTEKVNKRVECYDPSAGTGTLLMSLAHRIGVNNCNIFSQDISQRSTKLLKLNLILNNCISSYFNVFQGDTLVYPYHKSDDGQIKKFDFVVSNPPFRLDFSDTREKIVSSSRFWAGVPKVPTKKKESMAIYTCFIQHVINSLKDNGKGAIIVPTGFLTAKTGIERKVLEYLVNNHIICGTISMPSNIFANTGTKVSILFLDNSRLNNKVILMDASNFGEDYKDGNNQKRRLRDFEFNKIIDTYLNKEAIEDFSALVTYDEIIENNYSLIPAPYFDIKLEYVDISQEDFIKKMKSYQDTLQSLFSTSNKLQLKIMEQLKRVKYE